MTRRTTTTTVRRCLTYRLPFFALRLRLVCHHLGNAHVQAQRQPSAKSSVNVRKEPTASACLLERVVRRYGGNKPGVEEGCGVLIDGGLSEMVLANARHRRLCLRLGTAVCQLMRRQLRWQRGQENTLIVLGRRYDFWQAPQRHVHFASFVMCV